MVVESSSFVSNLNVRDFTPFPDNFVLILVVAHRNGIVDDVSALIKKFVDEFKGISFLFFNSFLFLFILNFLLNEFLARVFLVGLLAVTHQFAYIVPFFLEGVKVVAN